MNKISIVIITLNADASLAKVLRQAKKLSDDIIVIDSGSKDNTKTICNINEVQFIQHEWLGFGLQKNLGNDLAKNDWVLSIDADEVLSKQLIEELKLLDLNENKVYNIPFTNIYCGKEIKFGRWRNESHVRLFNKTQVQWNENKVHEALVYNEKELVKLKGKILHYSMNSKAEHLAKAKKYAQLGAQRLHADGKKATFIKLYINPAFRFVKDYIFTLGFLDGRLGFQIAAIIAKETYWKYSALRKL